MPGQTLLLSAHRAGSSSKSQVHSSFLADVKKALGPEKMALLFQSLDNYKKSNDYDSLVTTVVSLFTEKDEDFHLLVRKYLKSPPEWVFKNNVRLQCLNE